MTSRTDAAVPTYQMFRILKASIELIATVLCTHNGSVQSVRPCAPCWMAGGLPGEEIVSWAQIAITRTSM